MRNDRHNFLLSLAAQLAGVVSADGGGTLAFGSAATGGKDALWIDSAPQDLAADPYAVLRMYGGGAETATGAGNVRRVPMAAIQCMVIASDASAGMSLATRLYEALHEANGADPHAAFAPAPRSRWTIAPKQLVAGAITDDATRTAWVVHAVRPLQPPGLIGRDAGNARWMIVFNFDVDFHEELAAV